jgi:hypothetical protein
MTGGAVVSPAEAGGAAEAAVPGTADEVAAAGILAAAGAAA